MASELLKYRKTFHKWSKKKQNEFIRKLTAREAHILKYESDFWLRDDQIIKGRDWRNCLALAGRGWGKTKTGACWIKRCVEVEGSTQLAICGPTHKDISQVMVPAILAEYPPDNQPTYLETKGKVIFPNGAIAYCYSSETELRGPNIEKCWLDEIAKWYNPTEGYDVLNFAVRVGIPQILITTTPKKEIKLIRKLLAQANKENATTKIVVGKTSDNEDNLDPSFIQALKDEYEGSRLFRQEFDGELLDDSEYALWTYDMIHKHRVKEAPELTQVIVAVDPAGSTGTQSDETGIIVVGLGVDGHAYVLEDKSGKYSPKEWANKSIQLYYKYQANMIVAEANFGGDMVLNTIKAEDSGVYVKKISATKSKQLRAEPVSVKYTNGIVHHVGDPNTFLKLEDQMVNFVPGQTGKAKDDRLDALVWGLTELICSRNFVRRNYDHLPNFG